MKDVAIRAGAGRERSIIIGLAAVVATAVALYLGLRSTVSERGGTGTLLPYQMLARDLVQTDQEMFGRLRQSLVDAETMRARGGSWPDASVVTSLPSSGRTVYAWTRTQQHIIVNYLGLPSGDVSAAAWLIRVQEPDPAAPVDSAPNDEEHHRLTDGTVLHVSIWTHRFGTQLPPAFFAKPETAAWTQVLTGPLNPIGPPLRSKN